jgi:phosphoenolpyruvate synthase/pyruvate phosphate dikinase
MENYIKWFSEVNKSHTDEIGQKAAYLAEAYNKKLLIKNSSIPEGFIITKNSIKEFYEKTKIKNAIKNIFEETNYDNQDELNRAILQIKELIEKTEIPEKISTEIIDAYETLSSDDINTETNIAYQILSTASEPIFTAIRSGEEPGNSYFNIKGNSSLISHVKKVLTSFFTEENLKNNHKNKINFEKLYSTIIIQKMVQSDKSGTITINDKYKIKTIWGFGTGLKEDKIGKDTYTLRRDARILEKNIEEKKYAITRDSSGSLKSVQLKDEYSFSQVLEDKDLHVLSDIALRIEDLFEEKIQFDFAIEDEDYFITKIELQKNTEENDKPIKKETTKENTQEKKSKETVEEKSIILPLENISKTKIELILNTKEKAELAENTLIKSGLIPLEKIIETRGIHPKAYIDNINTKGYEEVLTSGISENSKNLQEIWVRLSDFTTEDFQRLEGTPEYKENNPLMGLCGIRFLLTYPELLKRELKAIHNIKTENKKVGVLIPKISSLYELKKIKEFMKELNLEISIGVILETPASIQLIKDFIEEGIEAVYFSGDNLTQYLLAIDKNNEKIQDMYDDTTPALMYQVEYVIRVCKRRNIKTTFYGNATNKKEMIEFLTKKEISSIACSPENSNKIHEEIKKTEEKIITGTDKEPREYETNKEKERQKKEIEEFEKAKEEQAKKEAIELIKKEKEEFKKEIEAEEDIGPNDRQNKDLAEVKAAIKEMETEKSTIEDVNPHLGLPENSEKKPKSIEEAIKLIEEHNNSKPKETEIEKAMREIEEHNQNKNSTTQKNPQIQEITSHQKIKNENDQKSNNNTTNSKENEILSRIKLKEEEIKKVSNEDFGDLNNQNETDSYDEDFETQIIEELENDEIEEIPEFSADKKDSLGIF